MERAGNAAQTIAADLDAAFGARAAARREREAEDAARRLAAMRAGKAAHSNALIAMPRMAALMKAGALLGSAQALADALGIKPRSLRAKTGAERGVSSDDLLSAAAALDARAAALTQHAQKLRDEAGA
jgi:peptidoglycan/xylan/chitin deacetylase (PgdA/CDA1 family)